MQIMPVKERFNPTDLMQIKKQYVMTSHAVKRKSWYIEYIDEIFSVSIHFQIKLAGEPHSNFQ